MPPLTDHACSSYDWSRTQARRRGSQALAELAVGTNRVPACYSIRAADIFCVGLAITVGTRTWPSLGSGLWTFSILSGWVKSERAGGGRSGAPS
jgi:hypothetical protein